MRLVNETEFEKIVSQDIVNMQLAVNKGFFDDFLYDFLGQTSGCVNGGLKGSFVDATHTSVAAGTGFFYDATQVGYNPLYRMIQAAANVPVTHAAADLVHDRIDVVCMAPNFAVTATASRFVKVGGTGPVSLQTVNKNYQDLYTLQVVTGTPSGSPVKPAIPAGYMDLYSVLVTASTGISGSGAITDDRIILGGPTSTAASAITASNAGHVIATGLTAQAQFDELDAEIVTMLEEGIPFWSSTITYPMNGIVSSGGNIYVSLVNGNLNHAVTDATKWKEFTTGGSALNPQAPQALAARAAGNFSGVGSLSTASGWVKNCYAPELGVLMAVATAGTNQTGWTLDGKSWTSLAAPDNASWGPMAWSPEKGIGVCLSTFGPGGGGFSSMSTIDGKTWTTVGQVMSGPLMANTWNDVKWIDSLGLFVAVSSTGVQRVMTSPDGLVWTGITDAVAGAGDWLGMVWHVTGQTIVVVGAAGAVMTSTNATAWTSSAGSQAITYESVCYNPDTNRLVAVAATGTNQVMTSDNVGQTWTTRTPIADSNWKAVDYSRQLGVYFAIAPVGATQGMYSYDGVTWFAWTSFAAGVWKCILWIADFGVFSTVGTQTAGLTSAVSKYVGKFIN
jgi:hypothetical protein